MRVERGAPDLARAPVVHAPVEPRVYRQLFDRETFAEYLRLSTDTIDRLVKANKLRCIRIGQQVRFTLGDVDAFGSNLGTPRSLGGAQRTRDGRELTVRRFRQDPRVHADQVLAD